MAKKKGNNNNKSVANSVDSTAPKATEEPGASEQTAEGDKSVESMSIEELKAELLEARAEIASLKAQPDSSAVKASKPQEVQELHAKLQQLRKEQQEADAARDKAWQQLKAVVHEISSLANPDYLQSLVVKPQE